MKQTIKLFGLLAMLAILFSCEKEADRINDDRSDAPATDVSTLDPSEYLLGFGAEIEGIESKLSIDLSDGTVAFEGGEEVLVYVPDTEKTGKYVYNSSTSLFEPETVEDALAIGSKYALVYYPAACFKKATTPGSATMTLPAAVTAGSLSDLADKNPMSGIIALNSAADSEGNKVVKFKNLCSILRVSLTGRSDDADGEVVVTLSNTNSVPIAVGGAYTVVYEGDPSDADLVPTIYSTATASSISVTSGKLDADNATDFYFLLPAVSASGSLRTVEGLKVSVRNNGQTFERTRSNLTLSRSKILAMSFRAGKYYGGNGTQNNPWQIKTAEDFKQISKLHADEDAEHSYYKQVADIEFGTPDSKGKLTSSMIGASTSAPFTGNYDGNEKYLRYYSIDASTSPAGLFKYVGAATILNVKVKDFSVNGVKQVGGIIGNVVGAANISKCISEGGSVGSTEGECAGIVGRVNVAGVTISECNNSSSVTNTANANNNIGGILGYAAADVTITACTNSGTIDNQSGAQVGGIVGRVNGSITISACSNSGNISSAGGLVGGIAGLLSGGTMKGCFNTGTITSTGGTGYLGGLAGKIDGLAISDACYNSGIIKVSVKQSGLGGLVGVMGSVESNVVTTSSSISGKCYNTGAVISTVAESNYIGGIVGRLYGGVVSECRNNGRVGAWNTTDGITFSGLTVNISSVGGIVGLINSGVVKECYGGVSTAAYVRGGSNCGGIVGYISTSYDQRAIVLNCFNRTNVQSTNSGEAPIGGIVGYVNANKQQVSILNCLNWGAPVLASLNSSNTNTCIGGIVGKSAASQNANIRNCMSASTGSVIRQRVGSTDTAIKDLDLQTYKTYGLIYGTVAGKTIFRDIYYRNAANGANYMGTHSGTYASDNYRNMKTGVSNNVASNSETVTVNINKSQTETYEYTGYMYQCLTRGTYSPTNAGSKFNGDAYAGENYQLSDWVKVSDLSDYSLPEALYTLGAEFYSN